MSDANRIPPGGGTPIPTVLPPPQSGSSEPAGPPRTEAGAGDVGVNEARLHETRRSRADGFTQQTRQSEETEAERKVRSLAMIPGRISAPALVTDPAALAGRLRTGTLNVSQPLVAGQKIGPVRVRPDTTVRAQLAVTNNRVDFKNTRIDFVDSDGKPTDLDGPLWFDAEKVYIDEQGKIRADVPCFPDPNITETVLGKGVERVPEDPAEFARLLGERAGMPGGIELTPSLGARAQESQSPTAGDDPTAPRGTTAPTRGTTPPPRDAGATPTAGAREALGLALDRANLRVGFSGELEPGPLRLGNGAVFNLAEGARVRCKEGRLGEMIVEIDAPVRSVQLDADGTRLRSGAGRIKIDVDFNALVPGATDGERAPRVTFHELELENLSIETPAGVGQHRLQIRDRLSLRGDGAATPFVTFQGARGETPASLQLDFPELTMSQVTGELELSGTDGRPARLRLGDDGSGTIRPVSARARIAVDSRTRELAFDAQVQDFSAAITPLALVDTDGFDLRLGEHTLTGSGRVHVTSSGGRSRLELQAEPAAPWTLAGQIDDAQIGGSREGADLHLDLAAGSRGRLSIERLEIGSEGTPIIRGSTAGDRPVAEFDVTLDALSLALPGGHNFDIRQGTRGTLVIPRLEWQAGDRSPTVEAKVQLNLGAEALVQPGEIPGLEGARVKVDAKTGQTVLELDATVDRNGKVVAACGMRVRNFEVRTDLARGLDSLPEVSLPAERLQREPPPTLATMRRPVQAQSGPRPQAPAETLLRPPPLPSLELRPAQIFGAIDRTTVDVQIPARSLDGVHVEQGDYTFDFHRAGSRPISFALAMSDGRIQPDASRLTFDPPLVIKAVGRGLRPNPDLTIRGATVRDAGNGRGRLDLDIDIDHFGLAVLDLVPGWDTEEYIEGLVAEQLFGSKTLPLDGEAMLRAVGAKTGGVPEVIRVGGSPPRPATTTSAPATRPATATPRPATSPPPTAAPPPAGAGGTAELVSALNLGGATFNVADALLATERLDFGNGQGLTLRPGSRLSVSGTPRDFTITGHAALGAATLGHGDNRVSLTRGEADLRVHVRIGDDGKPRVTVDVTNLRDVTGLSAVGRVGAGTTNASFARIAGGEIHLDLGGARDDFKLALTGVEGQLVGGIDVGQGDRRLTTQSFTGRINGDLVLDNGVVRGSLRDVDLSIRGLGYASNAAGENQGSASIRGDAELTFDRRGQLVIERRGAGFRVDADVVTANGSRYQIDDGGADRLEIALGEPPTITARNATAAFSCVTTLPTAAAGGRRPVLDIRRARLQGDVQFGGAEGFKTLGRVRMREVDASIADLAVQPSEQSRLDLQQVDVTGNGLLEVSAAGGWVITEDPTLPAADRRIVARGVARDLRFATDSPEIHLDLASGANAVFDVRRLTVGGARGTSMDFGNGHFQGVVDTGTVTVGSPDSMLNRINFKPGTLVHADVGHLRSGIYVDGSSLATDVTLRIEGEFGDEIRPTTEEGVRIENVGFGGQMRMVLRALTDGRGNFSARSHTILDGDATVRGEADVDAAAAFNRARDAWFAERERRAATGPRRPR